MRFEFSSDSHQTRILAVFEDGDSYEGARQEGPGTRITYSGQDIVFDYGVESIHPDLLGLLCLIIFYPFIGERVTFPMPVSPRLEQAFSSPMFKSRFRFANVDDAVETYSGSRMALSFGGGIDSSAVRTILPDAFVVHEAHIRDGCLVPSHAHDIVRRLGSDKGRVVSTNQRYVSQPGGWHGWPCSVATSLLMATDHDFGMILTGSILGSTLLYNGSRYWDRFAARADHGFTGNYWQSAFNAVGIPMFSPVCGASEYLTMKLSLDLIHSGSVVYCMEREGKACLRCAKCFRRDVIRTVVEPGYRATWKPYDRSEIHSFLEHRPLYFGHIFSYARDRPGLPRFVVSRLTDLPDIRTDWPMRVHGRTLELCDEDWRGAISEQMHRHLDPMDSADLAELEAWDQTRLDGRARGWKGRAQSTVRGFRQATRRVRARSLRRQRPHS